MSNAPLLPDMAWTPPYDLREVPSAPELFSFCIERGSLHVAHFMCYPPDEFFIHVSVQEGDGWRCVWERRGKAEDAEAAWERLLASTVSKLMVVDVL